MLSLPPVQTALGKWATKTLNKDFNTNITIGRLSASAFTGNVHLKKIYVEDYKKDTLLYINELSTSVLNIRNAIKGKLSFGDVDMEELTLNIKTYKGETDTNLDVFVAKFDDDSPPSGEPFLLTASEVTIDGGSFRIIDENQPNQEVLSFSNLQADVDDFKIEGPNVTGNIQELSLLNDNGLKLERLAANFSYSKEQMQFENLFINTQDSHLKGSLTFNYNREEFADFVNKVKVNALFVDSKLSFKDINSFYNEFGGGEINFSTEIKGVLNEFTAKDLDITSRNTIIKGDFNFLNLFTERAPFRIEANFNKLSSNYRELKQILPNILGKTLPSIFGKFGQFTITGTSAITEHEINARVNLYTDLGSSYSDLSIINLEDIDNAKYVGSVSLQDFELGNLIEDNSFGSINLDVEVNGQGFTQETLNTEVIGKVFSLNWNNYTYKDLDVSGILKDQLFDGNLLTNDPNLKLNFKGLADFSQELNSFDFKAQVDYANFKTMNIITRDSVSVFKGEVKMDIVGTTIDNISGTVNFKTTSYTNPNDTYYFDDFNIVSSFKENGNRLITINSPDIINGTIEGKYTYKEIGKLVQNSIGSIYANYSPHEISPGQNLNFNLKIYNKIVEVFVPELALGTNTTIRGKMDADNGDFKLTFKSPEIMAYGNTLDNVSLQVDNKNPLFNTFIEITNINTKYYNINDFNLINTSIKDTLFFRTEFKGGKNNADSYNLNFYHTFNQDRNSVVGLKKSDVTFKNNTWYLNMPNNTKNKAVVNNKLDSIQVQNLVLEHKSGNIDERIELSAQVFGKNQKDIQLQFDNVSLEKITPSIEGLSTAGKINGNINFLQQQKKYLPSSNLSISNLYLNKYAMGDLDVIVFGNDNLTNYFVNAQLKNNNVNDFTISGNVTYDKGTNANLLVNFNGLALEPFSNLGGDVITNIRGDATGTVRVTGSLDNPNMNGDLYLNNAGVKIPYLNTDYDFLSPAQVNFAGQSFNLNNIILSDIVYNTKATLSGAITHNKFSDWYLNLLLDTEDQRFLALNKPPSEEELYYGKGFMSGYATITGFIDELFIKVEAATEEGTSIKIPVSDVATIGDYSFINFISKNETQEEKADRVLQDIPGLEMEFDLDVQPNAEVEIVIDPETGSSLRGTGAGNLLLEINTKGKFNMYGDFTTWSGDYNFKYGGFIEKKFSVKPLGTINWSGDPLRADVNIEAIYTLSANPAPILENQNFTRRITTDVVIKLEDQLMQPTLGFDIQFPGTGAVLASELESQLDDPAKRELQAISLLSQGIFISQFSISEQLVVGNVIQSANSWFNQALSTGNDKFNVGVNYEQGFKDARTGIETQDRFGLTVSSRISDKIIFNGEFGVPVGVSETVVAGDVEIEILLNEDGTLRAKVFNRENDIQQFVGEDQGYTQGIGLSYQVEFDTFEELLQKIFVSKKKRDAKQLEQQKNDSIKATQPDEITTMGNGLIKVKKKSSTKQ
jgi:hypothetical protein